MIRPEPPSLVPPAPGRHLRTALAAGLLVLLARAPALAQGDIFSTLSKTLSTLDEVLDAPEAAPIRAVDLYGKRFDLKEKRGKIVLLTFLDRDSANEAIHWLERQTTWLLHQPGVSFVNVFYPGGMFFMIPRGEAVHRIRQEVGKTRQEMMASLPPDEQKRLEAADIRWVVDWKRGIASRYPVERGRANLFLLDELGRIREVLRYDPEDPRDHVRSGVIALLEERARRTPDGAAEDL